MGCRVCATLLASRSRIVLTLRVVPPGQFCNGGLAWLLRPPAWLPASMEAPLPILTFLIECVRIFQDLARCAADAKAARWARGSDQ